MTEHCATTLVVLSFAPGCDQVTRSRLEARTAAALEERDKSAVTTVHRGPGIVGMATGVRLQGTVAVLSLGQHTLRLKGRLLAPSGEASFDSASARIEADSLGVKHIYMRQESTWAAASTSSLCLGAIGRPQLDEASLGQLAILGHLVGSRTLLRDVTRVPVAHRAFLSEGRISAVPIGAQATETAVHGGAAAMRESVGLLLDAYPDLGLELSGGLDSRVLLASIPRDLRIGRSAITLGRSGDPDVVLARRIAEMAGLDHRIIAPIDARTLSPDSILEGVLSSARRREHAADALAAFALDAAESRAPLGPRLTGVNGEFVRGFYYPGGTPSPRISKRRVERLARWRLFVNHRADPALFERAWLREAEADIIETMTKALLSYHMPWREATDRFYVEQRIPNWAGPGYSHAVAERVVLAPFLHPTFMTWAGGVPPSERSRSAALAAVLCELDPELSRLPLAGGNRPSTLARRGTAAAAANSWRIGVKTARKVRQRLRGERLPPIGVEGLVAPVAAALRGSRELRHVCELSILSPEAHTSFVQGAIANDQPSVSFVSNLVGLHRFMANVARREHERLSGRPD
jgi:asparagine synthase (glutamine-hydrolysing)